VLLFGLTPPAFYLSDCRVGDLRDTCGQGSDHDDSDRSIVAMDAPPCHHEATLTFVNQVVENTSRTISFGNWRWEMVAVGKSGFGSPCKASPGVRQVKKQHLVGRIGDQLCQLQALGPIESALFRSHPPPHFLSEHTHPPRETLWRPILFRDHTLINCPRGAGTLGSRLTLDFQAFSFDKGAALTRGQLR
jgi:hypothetical protein